MNCNLIFIPVQAIGTVSIIGVLEWPLDGLDSYYGYRGAHTYLQIKNLIFYVFCGLWPVGALAGLLSHKLRNHGEFSASS